MHNLSERWPTGPGCRRTGDSCRLLTTTSVTATGKWSMHPSQRRHDPQIASDEPDITRERRSPDRSVDAKGAPDAWGSVAGRNAEFHPTSLSQEVESQVNRTPFLSPGRAYSAGP